jgi:predicted dehydrogenase
LPPLELTPLLDRFPLSTKPNRPIKIGLIGLGYITRAAHLPAITLLRQLGWPIDITAICDLNKEAVTQYALDYPDASTHADAEALLKETELDAVLIAVWPPAASKLTRAAVARGLAVLVEKPVAHDGETIGELEQFCTEQKAILQVGYNRQWQPLAVSLREIVNGQALTEARATFYRASRDEPDFYRDTIGHPLTFLRSICGELELKNASWDAKPQGRHIAARAYLQFETSAGIPVSLEVQPQNERVCEIYDFCFSEERFKLSYPAAPSKAGDPAYLETGKGPSLSRTEEVPNTASPSDQLIAQGFLHQMAAFLSTTSGAAPPKSTPSLCDARRAMELYSAASLLNKTSTSIYGSKTPSP